MVSKTVLMHDMDVSRAWSHIPTRTSALLLPLLTPTLPLVLPCKLLFQIVSAHCSHRVPVGASYETCKNGGHSPIRQIRARLSERHNNSI